MKAVARCGLRERYLGITHRLRARAAFGCQLGDAERFARNPIFKGLEASKLVAQLVVVAYAPCRKIDLEHLAGPQATAYQNVCRIDLDGSHLGGKEEPVVAGYVVARGPEAVAVECGAECTTIGIGDSGRSIPGLHEHRLVGVVCPTGGRERLV